MCRERLKFDREYGMQRGSTDNSYIIVGERSTALLDLPDKSFAQAFAKTVDCANVDFIVLGHLSPKRLDSLAALLEARPRTRPRWRCGARTPPRRSSTRRSSRARPRPTRRSPAPGRAPTACARLRTVRTGDALDLGGRSLDFVTAPTPRWPDTVVTYDTASKFLFTSKLFSAHVATDAARPTDADASDGFEECLADWRYFFDCMLAPMARPASAALDKLAPYLSGVSSSPGSSGSSPKKPAAGPYVAPKLTRLLMGAASKYAGGGGARGAVGAGARRRRRHQQRMARLHGAVVRSARAELAREYREWVNAQIAKADDFSIAVIYASAYGNTSAMAQAIARGRCAGGRGGTTPLRAELVGRRGDAHR